MFVGVDAARARPVPGWPVWAPARRSTERSGPVSRSRARAALVLPTSYTHWQAADLFAARLGLGDDVRRSLVESYERWDGKGAAGLAGEEIRLTSRVVYLADVVAAFERLGGCDAAVAWRGSAAAPSSTPNWSSSSAGTRATCWPDWTRRATGARSSTPSRACAQTRRHELDQVLAAMGDFADLKSPYFIGHSRAVADLAGRPPSRSGSTDRGHVTSVGRAWCTTSGGWASPTRSGTSRAR